MWESICFSIWTPSIRSSIRYDDSPTWGLTAFLTRDVLQALPYWNQTQLSAFEAVLDAFQGYDNLAGVFVANEAMTFCQSYPSFHCDHALTLAFMVVNGSDTAPFIKAAIRDVKSYRESKKYRDIPVGYSAGESVPHVPSHKQLFSLCTLTIQSILTQTLNYTPCFHADERGYS